MNMADPSQLTWGMEVSDEAFGSGCCESTVGAPNPGSRGPGRHVGGRGVHTES